VIEPMRTRTSWRLLIELLNGLIVQGILLLWSAQSSQLKLLPSRRATTSRNLYDNMRIVWEKENEDLNYRINSELILFRIIY
jgi:hypothetical protein